MKVKFTEIIEFTDKPCDKFEGKCRYVSTGSLHGNTIIDDETVMVSYGNRPSRANLKVKSGDIIFAKMQSTHKTLLIDENLSNNIYSTGFFAVSPKKDIINKKCLFYLINNKVFLDQKDRNCSGATQKAINKQGLSLIELNVPALKDQEEICRILDTVENTIRIRQMQIKRLDDLVKARFVEMFGDPNKTSKYQFTTLDKIGYIVTGGTPSTKNNEYYDSKDIMFIKPSDINENQITQINTSNMYISKKAKAAVHIFPKNIVLTTCIGIIGKVGVLSKEGTCNQQINAIIPNGKINCWYLAYALLFKRPELNTIANAPVVPIINKTTFSKIQIFLPPLELQGKFSDFVEEIDKSKFVVI